MVLKLFLITETSGGGVILHRILAGATSGCFAVFLFQPTEVVKIRMQAEHDRYKGCIDAYRYVYNGIPYSVASCVLKVNSQTVSLTVVV